jgi:hypothetical protein
MVQMHQSDSPSLLPLIRWILQDYDVKSSLCELVVNLHCMQGPLNSVRDVSIGFVLMLSVHIALQEKPQDWHKQHIDHPPCYGLRSSIVTSLS